MRDKAGARDRVEVQACSGAAAPAHKRILQPDACGGGEVSTNGNGGLGGDGGSSGQSSGEENPRGDAEFETEEEDDGQGNSDDEEDSDSRKYSIGFVEGDRVNGQVDAHAEFGAHLVHHTLVVLGILLVSLHAEGVAVRWTHTPTCTHPSAVRLGFSCLSLSSRNMQEPRLR